MRYYYSEIGYRDLPFKHIFFIHKDEVKQCVIRDWCLENFDIYVTSPVALNDYSKLAGNPVVFEELGVCSILFVRDECDAALIKLTWF